MNKRWWSVALAAAAGCGSVSSTSPDAAGGSGATGASLTLAKTSRWVPQGANVQVPFTIARTTSMGALTLHVASLPAGVTAADVAIDAGATSGVLTLAATNAAALGATANVMVELTDGTTNLDSEALTVKVSGASGTLDTTFGTAGRRVIALPDPVVAATSGKADSRTVLVYPPTAGAHANKIVIVGNLETTGAASTTRRFAVIRLNADGTPDTGFGTNGYLLLDPGASNGINIKSAFLDAQNRIVFVAYNADTSNVCRAYVNRVTTAGVVDSTFTAFNDIQPGGYCGDPEGIVPVGSDKLMIVSQWNNPDGSQLQSLMGLNANGTVDNTAFGTTYAKRVGAVVAGKTMMHNYAAMSDAQGGIILAGAQCAGGWNTAYSACESTVARMKVDGTWDSAFGTNGYTALTFGTTTSTTSQTYVGATVDSTGRIIAAGYNEGATSGTLARFTATGALDTGFGVSGRLSAQLVTGATQFGFYDVVTDEEDRILVAAYGNSGGPLLVNARYLANGSLDTSYGTNGFSTTASSPNIWHMAMQHDGRLIIAGAYPRTGGGYEVATWRYWP